MYKFFVLAFGFFLAIQTAIASEDLSPEKFGYSAQKLGSLRALLDPYVEDGRLPNYLLSIYLKGELIYEAKKGYVDTSLQVPVARDNIFWIASMTKPVTSVAALQLVEQGKLSLDAPVSDYLPEFRDLLVAPGGSMAGNIVPAERQILVRHLFTHTSGLSYGEIIVGPSDVSKMYDDLGLFGFDEPTDQKMANLASVPLRAQPGSEFNYSMGTDVLGALIERISGMSLGAYMEKNIFTPLGMNDTGFYIPASKRDRVAALFEPKRVTVQVPGQTKSFVPSTNQNYCNVEPRFHSGGAGLCSTVDDYSKFLTTLLNDGLFENKRILKPTTLKLLLENQLSEDLGEDPVANSLGEAATNIDFSLGLGITTDKEKNPRYYWWAGAANTFFWFDKKSQLSGVFMTHHFPVVYMLIDQLYSVTSAAKL